MGKVVKFTGSRLLGEELRRMRGGRTLDDVVEMGKSKLVPSGFRYVGKGTLSDIENGKVLPNLESVFALSVLYQVPASRFLHFLLEENSATDAAGLQSDQALTAAHLDAVTKRDWTRALGVAVVGVRMNASGWQNVRWRLNRAAAIERLGMRTDAITELNELVHDAALPVDRRWMVHADLARMHAASAQTLLARMHAVEAAAQLPVTASGADKQRVLETQLYVFFMARECGHEIGVTPEQAEGWLRETRLLSDRADLDVQTLLDCYQARIHALKGENKFARRLLASALEAVLKAPLPHRQVETLIASALVDVTLPAETALSRLQRAADIAIEHNFVDRAFYVLVILAARAESTELREHFMRRCRRLYPLVQSSSPGVKQYLELLQHEVQ